jgi:hypothetical protein
MGCCDTGKRSLCLPLSFLSNHTQMSAFTLTAGDELGVCATNLLKRTFRTLDKLILPIFSIPKLRCVGLECVSSSLVLRWFSLG